MLVLHQLPRKGFLSAEALTFSILETATHQLCLDSVWSPFLLSFSYFLPSYSSISRFPLFLLPVVTSFLASHIPSFLYPLIASSFQFIPSALLQPFRFPIPHSPFHGDLTSLHYVQYSRPMMHCSCTRGWNRWLYSLASLIIISMCVGLQMSRRWI